MDITKTTAKALMCGKVLCVACRGTSVNDGLLLRTG